MRNPNRLSPIVLLFFFLLYGIGCSKQIRTLPPPPEIAAAPLLVRCQEEQKAVPPVKGLMKVTFDDKFYKKFWARWSSGATIQMEGFDLLGGTLFELEMEGDQIALITGKGDFYGSRDQFREQLKEKENRSIRVEWLTLFDWIARAGLPPCDLFQEKPTGVRVEEQETHLTLHFVEAETAIPIQTVQVNRATLRITEATLFDPQGEVSAKVWLNDYRSVEKAVFPFLIKMEARGKKMEIVFKELVVNSITNEPLKLALP
jgi:hypothetical protein